jgi:hypothetical protein
MIRPLSIDTRNSLAEIATAAGFACLRGRLWIGLALLVCHLGLGVGSAESAEILTFRPETGPAVVLVRGELALADGIQFAKKTDNIEHAIVRLESPGGMMIAGLVIGRTIRRKGFITVVPKAAECASACALAWLGGTERYMGEDARIGFHAAYLVRYGRPHRSEAVDAIVMEYLEELKLPRRAISYITSSPPQGLNMLTMARARDLGVDVNAYGAEETTASADVIPARAGPAIQRLPRIDLYGRSLPNMPILASSADDCEVLCGIDRSCTAFTFDATQLACFLRANAVIAVSHPAAVSGLRAGYEREIRQAHMTVQEATDYPGNDIERQTGTSLEACLISCNVTSTCRAFTYVIHRHECWLKSGTGPAEPRDGLVSGFK